MRDMQRSWPLHIALAERGLPPAYRLQALLDAGYERNPHVALAAGPKRAAGRYDDARFHQAQGVGFVVPIGHSDPQVEAGVGGQVCKANALEEPGKQGPLLAEDAA